MKVLKKINHNSLLVEDDNLEKIVMGKGIGFSAIIGENIDSINIDKTFVLDTKAKTKMFGELVSAIPMEYIEFSEEIIQYIKKQIKAPLDSNIYIALTDHIYFAIQRQKEDTQIVAIMLPEMKLFYPEEYTIAEDVVDIINERYNTQLGINEVGFITMHIINAELGENNSFSSLKILELTSFILKTLKRELDDLLVNDSLSYHRLLVHVKFLSKRLVFKEKLKDDDLSFFKKAFKKNKAYKVSLKVKKELEENYDIYMQENEIIYLAIHLARIE